MTNEYDAIASIVLEEFRKLPTKRKPCVRDNGLHEWVPLSGIVAKGPGWIRCVALATGMKCLPASKLPQANGMAIHDWHAEVLAIRAFNYFVLEECKRLVLGDDEGKASDFIRRRTDAELAETTGHKQTDEDGCWNDQPFTWREDVTLHMFCSEAPCGDASMELIMAAQDDASPWDIPPPLPEDNNNNNNEPLRSSSSPQSTRENPYKEHPPAPPSLPGRAFFSQLAIVRRKPSRGDAPPSLSKSCSDKLALKQCTSLLSALSSIFISPKPAYLASLILPSSQYSPTACHRCFSASSSPSSSSDPKADSKGRMNPLLPYHKSTSNPWTPSGYAFTPFTVQTTTLEFDFSKRSAPKASMVASNLAVAWTTNGLNEGLIGGVLQGRKKFDIKGASSVSRRRLWDLAAQVAEQLDRGNSAGIDNLTKALTSKTITYDELKESLLLKGRRSVKEEARQEALRGWIRNTGDGGFRLSDR